MQSLTRWFAFASQPALQPLTPFVDVPSARQHVRYPMRPDPGRCCPFRCINQPGGLQRGSNDVIRVCGTHAFQYIYIYIFKVACFTNPADIILTLQTTWFLTGSGLWPKGVSTKPENQGILWVCLVFRNQHAGSACSRPLGQNHPWDFLLATRF